MVLVVFNVLSFAIPFVRNRSFWVAYVFSMISIIFFLATCLYAFKEEKSLKSKFYGWSIILIACGYTLIQCILSLIFMAIPVIPFWITIVVCILCFAIGTIGIIVTDASINEVEKLDKTIAEKVFYIKSLQIDIEFLKGSTTDVVLVNSLKELAETIQYSDPMSSEKLSEIESDILHKAGKLKDVVKENKTDLAQAMCLEIKQLMVERNKKCKLLKN